MRKRGYFGGYTDFRYGDVERRPVRMPKIFEGEKRKHVVGRLKEVMGNWQSSPFQHEGNVRHGIRSNLCLDGVSWPLADYEAEQLVAEALDGKRRPTWLEGQPNHVDQPEACLWCSKAFDESAYGGNRWPRYCSESCAKMALEHRDFTHRDARDRDFVAAKILVRKNRAASRPCKQCGESFKPHVDDGNQQYCSVACVGLSKRVPERRCAHCGGSFHSKDPNQRFCTPACRIAEVGVRTCEWCGSAFEAEKLNARFCCRDHKEEANRLRQAERLGRAMKIRPGIFDHFITAPVEAALPRWITPERFDHLVAA
jgi:hypothetical protein